MCSQYCSLLFWASFLFRHEALQRVVIIRSSSQNVVLIRCSSQHVPDTKSVATLMCMIPKVSGPDPGRGPGRSFGPWGPARPIAYTVGPVTFWTLWHPYGTSTINKKLKKLNAKSTNIQQNARVLRQKTQTPCQLEKRRNAKNNVKCVKIL